MKEHRRAQCGIRGFTRLYALQVLYSNHFLNKDAINPEEWAEDNVEILISEEMSVKDIDKLFFVELINKLQQNLPKIDAQIQQNIAKTWSFDRLDKVMQELLRLGVCEILFFNEIPHNVIFNEYIEIAKAFFDKSEVSFVNGLLNSISNKVSTERQVINDVL